MDKELLEAMIAAGWDRVCAAVREAGRKAISEPGARKRLADALRKTAELLEKGGRRGVLQPNEEAGSREEGDGH